MKKEILLELASKWNKDVNEQSEGIGQDTEEFRISEALERGKRQAISECAKKLTDLVNILG